MVARVAAADLQHSTVNLYQPKWSRFLGWCHQRDIEPCKASVPQVAEFFLYLRHDLGLFVPAVKGCPVALNHVFSLTGVDLASNPVVLRMFRSFEKSCPLCEVRPPDWNLSLVLQCLSRPPFEPLKLSSDKQHLTWKTSFLLAPASAKRVSELHSLSFVFIILVVGDPAPLFFLTLWPRPKILWCLTLATISSQSHPWLILWTVTGINSCSVPSGLFTSTVPFLD